MKSTGAKKTIKRRRITFSMEDEQAHEIAVSGDFNEWNRNSHPMKRNGNNSWKKIMMLPPGKYEYKFLVDGEWRIDPDNPHQRPNCFGTLNNVLQVQADNN